MLDNFIVRKCLNTFLCTAVVCGGQLKCFWCRSSRAVRNPDCERVNSKTNATGEWCRQETHYCYTFNTTVLKESAVTGKSHVGYDEVNFRQKS